MKVVLYHTTDLHGYVYPTNYIAPKNLGLLKIGSYMRADEQKYDASLKIDCGDLIQGSPLTHYLSKQNQPTNSVMQAMQAIGFDAYVLGNHEFNYGKDYLYAAYKPVEQHVINANILGLDLASKPYQVHDFNGFKIACIGLTTSFIPNWENAENIAGLEFADPVEMYAHYEPMMQAEADFIIVCYHGGFEKSVDEAMVPTEKATKENQGSELLERFSSINMVLSGHQHRSFMTQIGEVICSQPLNNGQNFGKIVIDTETKAITAELVDVETIQTPIDPQLEALFTTDAAQLEIYLDQEIGKFNAPLLIDDLFQARFEGHPFVNLLHQVQLETSGADFSALSLFDNAIGFTELVTIRDVIINYPYPNTLKVLAVTGEQLKQAVEKAATYFVLRDGKVDVNEEFIIPKQQHYNYDMFAGFNYTIDLQQPFGERVQLMTKTGEPLDLTQTYTIALNNYRATNTAIYEAYEHARVVKDINLDIGELIINYFLAHDVVTVDTSKNYHIHY